MITGIIRITLAVREQQEALWYYTGTIDLVKKTDNPMGPTQRWLTAAPTITRPSLTA
jgi:hypothetical protein